MAEEPFVVHAPQSWKRLRKLVAEGQRKRGFVPRYKAECTGRKVELPPKVRIREDEDGPYFVAGPHECYYRKCPDCRGRF